MGNRCLLTANNNLVGRLKTWNRLRGPWRCRLSVMMSVAVRYGNYCYAYSTTLGTWDVLKLPPGEVAIPAVSDEGIGVHSASQGDFVFKNSWGKWFSAEEIKAGRVAEHLLAQRNAAPASQPDDKTAQEFVVFYLKNVEAAEAARIVRQVFGGQVNPAVEERTNSLIVASDDPLTVNRVRELLQAIELPAAKELALPQPAQSVDDLRQLYNELEQRTRELAARLRGPLPNPATGDRLNDELRETVQQAFEARQKLQRAELAEFTQRLQRHPAIDRNAGPHQPADHRSPRGRTA